MKTELQIQKEHKRFANSLKAQYSFGSNPQLAKEFPTFKHLLGWMDSELQRKLNEIKPVAQPSVVQETPLVSISPAPTLEVTKEVDFSFDWHYDNWTIELKPFQKKAVANIWHVLFEEKRVSTLLMSGTGTGKTYMTCAVLSRLQHEKWHESFMTMAPWPYLIVTKASVVDQFKSVAQYQFGLNLELMQITNYDQLRSNYGDRFIKQETIIKNGEPEIKLSWRKWMNPSFVVFDECHALKNEDSQQSKIAQALNDLEDRNLRQVHMSATPFTRVIDSKCFVVSAKREF